MWMIGVFVRICVLMFVKGQAAGGGRGQLYHQNARAVIPTLFIRREQERKKEVLYIEIVLRLRTNTYQTSYIHTVYWMYGWLLVPILQFKDSQKSIITVVTSTYYVLIVACVHTYNQAHVHWYEWIRTHSRACMYSCTALLIWTITCSMSHFMAVTNWTTNSSNLFSHSTGKVDRTTCVTMLWIIDSPFHWFLDSLLFTASRALA